MVVVSEIRRWYRRSKRRHPVPLWAHLAFVAAFIPGYLFLLGLDDMGAPDMATKLVIVLAQFLCFYLAIFVLLPRAFRYHRRMLATGVSLMGYLILDFVLVSLFLLAISLGSGALRLHWEARGRWVYDIANLPAIAVATCYFAGVAGVVYQVTAQSILLNQHKANLRKLVDRKRVAIQALELEWRRLQLDPHLMAGLLSRIRLMSQKDPEKMWKAMNRVIAIMQYYCSIPPSSPFVPLKEELKQVANFLALQELGRSKMYIHLQVADEVLNEPVIPMLLLMLVENQVKHGVVSDSATPAVLRVSRGAEDEGLCILARNAVRHAIDEQELASTGLGQRIIQSRLEESFPDRHDFRFGLDSEGRFRVEIAIQLDN